MPHYHLDQWTSMSYLQQLTYCIAMKGFVRKIWMDLSRPLPRFAILGIFSRFKVDLSLGMATLVQNDNNNIIIGCARQYFLSPVINHELSIVSLLVNPISRKINMSPPPYFPNIHCSCERVWQSISVLARQIHRSEEMFMCDRVPVYTQFPE